VYNLIFFILLSCVKSDSKESKSNVNEIPSNITKNDEDIATNPVNNSLKIAFSKRIISELPEASSEMKAALQSNNYDKILELVENKNDDINCRFNNSFGKPSTILFKAIRDLSRPEKNMNEDQLADFVENLIKKGADLTIANSKGNRIFFSLFLVKHPRASKILNLFMSNITDEQREIARNWKNLWGDNALFLIAKTSNNPQMVKELLMGMDEQASFNYKMKTLENGRNSLHIALQNKKISIVKELLKGLDSDKALKYKFETDSKGLTSLHMAIDFIELKPKLGLESIKILFEGMTEEDKEKLKLTKDSYGHTAYDILDKKDRSIIPSEGRNAFDEAQSLVRPKNL